MAKSWPEFYADYDGTKIFWKFWDFDQNNPVLKFDVFFAIISTWLHNYVPKFGLHGSFFTLNKMSQKDFEISKILQNLGMKSESRQWDPVCSKRVASYTDSNDVKSLSAR